MRMPNAPLIRLSPAAEPQKPSSPMTLHIFASSMNLMSFLVAILKILSTQSQQS